ncbi:hypothetical protein ACFLZM_04240 [Thermodesulfobacteriota bacterium]
MKPKNNLSVLYLFPGSRKKEISEARALVAYLAVEETGHKTSDVARILGVKRVSVYHALKKGKIILENSPSPVCRAAN